MASFPSLAAPFVSRRRLAPAAVAALALLLAVLFLIVMGALGAIFGLRPLSSGGYRPSQLARADIPAQYLQLYVAAGRRYGIDPWILAGIGSVETDHGRSPAPGVRSGVNAFGCCAGPMQFSVVGSPSTWDRYGIDGNDDGHTSVYDPADAIPAAARYLRASGAPDDYHAALFAYNHAGWYVAQVLTKAAQYCGHGARTRPRVRCGDDGIQVDSAMALLTRNSAFVNHDLGIEAVRGVTDGGGNRARGNGNPAQCTGVVCH